MSYVMGTNSRSHYSIGDQDITKEQAEAREAGYIEVAKAPRSDDEVWAFIQDELETRRRYRHNAKYAVEQAMKELAATEASYERCLRLAEALKLEAQSET